MKTASTAFDLPHIPRTAMEVHQMLPEGTLCEVIDNSLYMSPAPTPHHQKVIGKLFAQLYQHIINNNSGEVYLAPVDIHLDESNVVQPDILFINQGNLDIIKENGIYGVPDLIIEVLSSNKKHDTERKLALYEKFGVPEYFIVEPKTKEVLHFILQDEKYTPQRAEAGTVHSIILKNTFNF